MATSVPVLPRRALSRALLHRQSLLERTDRPARELITHLVGMQAQEPLDPYIGLWLRVRDFDPLELSGLLERREVLRTSAMRGTIHLLTAEDALELNPIMLDVSRRTWKSSGFAKELGDIDLEPIVAHGTELVTAEPLTATELGRRLAERWPDLPPTALSYVIRFLVPLAQVPPRGLWGRTGRAAWQTVEAWLGRPLTDRTSLEGIVLRYLAAFGPASVADLRTWSWLSGLREVVERLRPSLRTFRDESGRELFDLPDAPLPDPDTPAPPRFLPAFDNATLSHDDRTRIVPLEFRQRAFEGRTILVDGFVRGSWRLVRAGTSAVLEIRPYAPLAPGDEAALEPEADALLGLLARDANARQVRFLAVE